MEKDFNKIKFKRKLFKLSKFDSLLQSLQNCQSFTSIRIQLAIWFNIHKPTKNEKKIITKKLNIFINDKIKKIEQELPF